MWNSIKELNKKYKDVLQTPELISPILELRKEKITKEKSYSTKTNLFALDLAYSHQAHLQMDNRFTFN